MIMSFLEIENLNAGYGDRACIRDLGMHVEKGEIAVILGPSGCGKSTLLKTISGLLAQESGTIRIDGEDMRGMPPEKRPVSMVFQKALLFRNMNVSNNVNYAPRLLGTIKGDELRSETERMLEMVGLKGFGDRRSTELSGGQEQRVSLARALITRPKVLLLDEPLSALDAGLREEMRSSIRRICKELGQTVVFVTHDQEEAVAIADRIGLMIDGRIVQFAVAEEFYRHPSSEDVARFFGWRNLVPCRYDGRGVLESSIGRFRINGFESDPGEKTMVMRPEAFFESRDGPVVGMVKEARYMGVRIDYLLDCNGQELFVSLDSNYLRRNGEELRLDVANNGIWAVEPKTPEPESAEPPAKRRGILSLFRR